MFETSVVRAHAVSASRYRLLTLSLAVHSCAIAAIITATLISVDMPNISPKQMDLFRPASAPPPALGTPQPARTPAAPRRAAAITAPRVIPESGGQPPTAVQPAISAGSDSGGPLSSTEAAGTGDGNSVGSPDGVAGGTGDATPVIADVPPMRPGGEVKAPVILTRVMPDYPRLAVNAHMNGYVILECIIDKTGHIRDARVLRSSFAAFEQPALDAVQKWVFTPGSLHGEPVDTIFDLTVTFTLK
jgi:protein TonB